MQYISPFSLLGLDANEVANNPGSLNVSLLRKKMLAEFELNASVTIKTPLGELSKNDVLLVFDQLQNPDILSYHLQIAKDPVLLRFLEKNILNGLFSNQPVYHNDDFLRFISPYFAHSYCEIINYMLSTDGASNSDLYKIPLLLSRGEELVWLQPVRRKILGLISEIKNVTPRLKGRNYIGLDKTIKRIYGFNVIRVLNILPPEFFEHDTDAFAEASLELVSACINKKATEFQHEYIVKFVLNRLESLRLNGEYSEQVKHYLLFVNRDKVVGEKKGKNTTAGIFGFITALVLIIRLLTNSNHTDSSSIGSMLEELNKKYAESDSMRMKGIYKSLNLSYGIVYSLDTNKQSPSYAVVKTGENPFQTLSSTNISRADKKYLIKCVNHSNKNLIIILNNHEGNAYSFINKSDSLTLGVKDSLASVFFLAGEKWDSAFVVHRVRLFGQQEGSDFKGCFTNAPTNIYELLEKTEFEIPEIKKKSKKAKLNIPIFTFYSRGDSIKIIKYLPHLILEEKIRHKHQSDSIAGLRPQ